MKRSDSARPVASALVTLAGKSLCLDEEGSRDQCGSPRVPVWDGTAPECALPVTTATQQLGVCRSLRVMLSANENRQAPWGPSGSGSGSGLAVVLSPILIGCWGEGCKFFGGKFANLY